MRLKKSSNEALMEANAHKWIKLLVKRIYHAILDCVVMHDALCTDLEDIFKL